MEQRKNDLFKPWMIQIIYYCPLMLATMWAMKSILWGGLFFLIYLIVCNVIWQFSIWSVFLLSASCRGVKKAFFLWSKKKQQKYIQGLDDLNQSAELDKAFTKACSISAWTHLLLPILMMLAVSICRCVMDGVFTTLYIIVGIYFIGGLVGVILAKKQLLVPFAFDYGDGGVDSGV